ncbi:hypothetical protein ABW20_dc0109126 [Dactylellina cionopaga]|nr:hypothetical protein ABW20_dc0109126 [Dactylellina cionopaga]
MKTRQLLRRRQNDQENAGYVLDYVKPRIHWPDFNIGPGDYTDWLAEASGRRGLAVDLIYARQAVELVNPTPTSVSFKVSDYQDALDRIPLTVKLDSMNKDYQWQWGGSSLTFSSDKKQVPGTAEPYFVEGRNDGQQTWDWFLSLSSGYGGFLSDRLTQRYPKGRKVSKRAPSLEIGTIGS